MNQPLNTHGNADTSRQSPRSIPAGAEFKAGAIVNNTYEILDYLGRGAMGFVYRARHLILSKEYALKILGIDQVNETAWRRFQNEAQAIAKMNHPNVVGIHNFGLHLSQSNVDGATLAKAKSLRAVKKILWSDALRPSPFLKLLARSPNLVALKLPRSHLTPEDFQAISQMPNLKSLEISQNKLSTDALKSLSRLSHLTELNVQECGLKLEAVPVLKRFHSLRDLKILSKGTLIV